MSRSTNVRAPRPKYIGGSSPKPTTLRARYGIPDGAPVIGFVGSFRPWHGAREALRAFRIV
ncbi:MAG: hypothetical protein KC481_14425, partial [Acidimicrobiaceae bacterium]|nr:hypothetical protein [Acidimicrobiaceae bacterium]